MSAETSPHASLAEKLFADHLSNEAPGAFDELCRAHPELAEELCALRSSWRSLERVRAELSSVLGATPRGTSPRLEDFSAQLARAVNAPRVEAEIGRGGMGAVMRVWDATLRRSLAMKVIREPLHEGGAVAPELLARFFEEAQVTAQLDHPGIVPVHQLGIDETGRAYFTMKLVEGRTLEAVFEAVHDANCVRELNLLLRVCEAMAYAHAKGVVHRDLKPSNVMVGNFGEVYVMDWGLARVGPAGDGNARLVPVATVRAEERAATPGSPLMTETHGLVGTPEYAAPEQIEGRHADVGPWSDVYAVGATLYRLLAGRSPYVARGEHIDVHAVVARVLAGPPPSLSELGVRAAPELMAIQAKAMSRDPRARYRDMGELAGDLRAFLERRVVRAYEAGALAELKKWIARNRPFALASAAAALLLVVGSVVSTSLFLDARENEVRANDKAGEALANLELARRSERLAQANAADAEAAREDEARQRELTEKREGEVTRVATFHGQLLDRVSLASFGEQLGADLRAELAAATRRKNVGATESAHLTEGLERALEAINLSNVARAAIEANLLAPAARALDSIQAVTPNVELELRQNLADTYATLALFERAREQLSLALDIACNADGIETLKVGSLLNDIGRLLDEQGRAAEAESYYRAALEEHVQLRGADHAKALNTRANLAVFAVESGRIAEADELIAGVLAVLEQNGELETRIGLRAYSTAGAAARARGDLAASERWHRRALDGRRCAFGDDDPDTLTSHNNLATVLSDLGKLDEARDLLARAYEPTRRRSGDVHPNTASLLNNIGMLEYRLGNHQAARDAFARASAAFEASAGPVSPSTLTVMHNHANSLWDLKRFEEAAEIERVVVERRRASQGDSHPATLASVWHHASALQAAARFADAAHGFEELAELWVSRAGEGEPKAWRALEEAADCYVSLRRDDLAAERLRKLVGWRDEAGAARDLQHARLLNNLGYVLRRSGRAEEAHPVLELCCRLRRELGAAHSADNIASERMLALTALDLARWDEARERLSELEALCSVAEGDQRETLGVARVARARIDFAQGRSADAEREVTALLADEPTPNVAIESLELRAEMHSVAGRFGEADACFERARELLRELGDHAADQRASLEHTIAAHAKRRGAQRGE